MEVSLLISCLGFLALFHEGEAKQQCSFNRVYKMLAADCALKNFVQVPVVQRSVEVLDASGNRIRSLKNDSFLTYESLKFLYLFDNSITIIEPGAFVPLVNLEVLDLHLNAIREVPPILPYTLRKLNLADNDLSHKIPLEHVQSLSWLSLAGNRLSSVPDTGILPQLQELNITDNPLQSLTIAELSKFCQMETILLPLTIMNPPYLASCDCVKTNIWILKHSIYVFPQLNCTIIDESECLANRSVEAENVYSVCEAKHKALAWSNSSFWVLVAAGVILLLVIAIFLFILWRRKYSKPRTPPMQPSAEEVRKRKLLKRSCSRSFASRASFRSKGPSSRTSKDCTTSSSKTYSKASPTTKSTLSSSYPPHNPCSKNSLRDVP